MNAPRKVRCRQGHVYDLGAQPLCPKCGEGPAEAQRRQPDPQPQPGPEPVPAPLPWREWLARLYERRAVVGAVAALLAVILLLRLFPDDGLQALDIANPLGLSQPAIEAAILNKGDRALNAGALDAARDAYAPLAKAGNAMAHFKLGEIAERAGDAKAAFRHYRAAAEGAMTIADAQFRLGVAYENGYGTSLDRDKAITAYRAAARQEFVPAAAALTRLAVPQQPGPDLASARLAFNDKRYAAAFPALQALAAEGSLSANQLLGEMQFYGQGMPPNPVAAVGTFERGARNGYGPSQYFLGYSYAKGTGVAVNVAEAYAWYWLALQRVTAPEQRQWVENELAALLPSVPPGDKAAVDRLLGL